MVDFIELILKQSQYTKQEKYRGHLSTIINSLKESKKYYLVDDTISSLVDKLIDCINN